MITASCVERISSATPFDVARKVSGTLFVSTRSIRHVPGQAGRTQSMIAMAP